MYKYIFSDKDSEKINEKVSLTQNLMSKFDSVDSKYTFAQREVEKNPLKLEKMEWTSPTQEEIKKTAENSLFDYKNESLEKINSDYESANKKIDSDLESEKSAFVSRKDELESLYGSLKKEASDDALKRGLARSSIIVSKLEAFDNSMLDNFMKLDSEYQKKFSELNSEKSLLEMQKQNALSSFDIAYAVKLEDKINSLNSEIKAQEEKVLKYNNEIAEKEAEYEKQLQELENKIIREDRQDNLDLVEYLTKEGTVAYDDLRAREKYEYAYETLKGLSKDEALNELQNNVDYRKHLGRYYDRLVSIFQNG